MSLTASLLFLLAADGAAQTAAAPLLLTDNEEPNARAMNMAEIRASNAKRTADDPNYIRCRKEVKLGSLVAAARICHTNSQWAAKEDSGNRATRELIERTQGQGYQAGN